MAGIRKETFEELLKAAAIPAKYYCRRSFATWDVLLPSQELAAKLAGESINSKYFRLQPEYMGRRRIRITVCNVPIELNEEVLAAFLCKYGDIEDITKAKSSSGTAHGDYIFTMCLDRGGFQAIPHTLDYETQVMTVVVEGRKPQCWNCKQLGHFSKSCPQKTNQTQAVTATTATIAAAAAAATVTKEKTTTTESEGPHSETGGHPDKEEGWTQVQRGKKKKNPKTTNTTTSTIAVTTMAATTSTTKEHQAASSATGKTTKQQPAKQLPESSSSAAATTKKSHGEEKERNNKETECMEVSVNLKRRRDSGDSQKDGGEKKHIKKPPQDTKIQSQTPSQSQPKGEENITKSPERPAQLIHLPQQTKNTLTDDFPLSLKSPQLSPITTPKLITRSHSVTRTTPPPPPPATKQRSQSASSEVRRAINAFYFCEDILEPQHLDHILKKALKPLFSMKKIDNIDITNPHNFKNAPMLTTFVRTAGGRTKELWQFIEEASRADVMLADTTNIMLKKMLPYCAGRVPILVHPSFYRSLKLRYPMDVGGITRDDRVSTELGTGSLRQAVGILTPKDFRPVVDSE